MEFNMFSDPSDEAGRLKLSRLSLKPRLPKGPSFGNHARQFVFTSATGANTVPAFPHGSHLNSSERVFAQKKRRIQSGPGAYFAAAAGAIQAHLAAEDERERERERNLNASVHANQDHDIEMGDTNGRHDDRRGGGDYGRKRRYREDDESENRGNFGRRGGFDPRRNQRRRHEETTSTRVRNQILAIADSPLRDPEEDVVAIASNIVEHYEDGYFRNHIADILVQLSSEQAFKIPFVAAITLYANQQKAEFGKLILEKAGARLQDALEAGEWVKFKLLLRFLGSLQSMFEGDGIFPMLEELFNRAADLQTASSEDSLGVEIVKMIMLTLPYVLASTDADVKELASELLTKTDIIASAPREVESIVNPYVTTISQDAPQLHGAVYLLQKQLQTEADGGWKLEILPRLFKPTEPKVEQNETSETVTSSKHPFPTIAIPQSINPGPRPLFPEVYFSLYADQDVETVPPTTSLAASLFRDTLVDTINILDFNRIAAAKFLIDIDCYWASGTFVKRATPFDKVKDAAAGKSTWKPEDLAVDAIFSQMLQLPMPEHKLVYYHSMITETCKIAPGSIAPSLGRAIRYLYKNLDTMDVELSYRFLDWFAHHLSNFDFRWKWAEWIDDVERINLDPRKAFILGALDKEIRLSFAKRVRDTLPEQYHVLIPESKDNDIPEFKYNNKDTPYSSEGTQIIKLLKRKAPESEIQPLVESIQEKEASLDSHDPLLASTDAYVTALCYIGSKSLSHVLSYIERCKERLIDLGATSPAARNQIITSVVDYWRDVQPGVAVNVVDKLLNYTVLTPTSVVEWALAPERMDGGRFLAETWVYEMVERTLGKVTGRVRSIVTGRSQKGLTPEQVEHLDQSLGAELQSMRALFAVVDDALVGVADGSNDVMLENDADEASETTLMRNWGMKWRRVFSRKLAVEETVIAEATKCFPPAAEEVMAVDGGEADGVENENGVGSGMEDAAAANGEDEIL